MHLDDILSARTSEEILDICSKISATASLIETVNKKRHAYGREIAYFKIGGSASAPRLVSKGIIWKVIWQGICKVSDFCHDNDIFPSLLFSIEDFILKRAFVPITMQLLGMPLRRLTPLEVTAQHIMVFTQKNQRQYPEEWKRPEVRDAVHNAMLSAYSTMLMLDVWQAYEKRILGQPILTQIRTYLAQGEMRLFPEQKPVNEKKRAIKRLHGKKKIIYEAYQGGELNSVMFEFERGHLVTYLHFLVMVPETHVLVPWIIVLEADVTIADSKGKTPLEYAQSKGYLHVAEILKQAQQNQARLRLSSNPENIDELSNPPLLTPEEHDRGCEEIHQRWLQASKERITSFLEQNPDINTLGFEQIEINGQTIQLALLHWAVRGGPGSYALSILTWLFENYRNILNVNVQDELGNTSLHYAYLTESSEAIEFLENQEAIDKYIKNHEEKYALELKPLPPPPPSPPAPPPPVILTEEQEKERLIQGIREARDWLSRRKRPGLEDEEPGLEDEELDLYREYSRLILCDDNFFYGMSLENLKALIDEEREQAREAYIAERVRVAEIRHRRIQLLCTVVIFILLMLLVSTLRRYLWRPKELL
jgi:hypothetical protein